MNSKKDFCQYADVFYGNGEVDHYAEDGLASKWFYIKALCGNTMPHPVLPFGRISVGAYSGGYPTGYGTHCPNNCGGIRKLCDELRIRGFSHIHHSGIGGIKYYYNYAVTCPFYGEVAEIAKFHPVTGEAAKPGYYTVSYNDIKAELTVNAYTALHRYTYQKDGGRLAVDFSNDGLSKMFSKSFYAFAKEAEIVRVSDNEVLFSGILSGVKLYFCVQVEGQNVKSKLFANDAEISPKVTIGESLAVEDTTKMFGGVFDFEGNEVLVKVSYSTLGYEEAQAQVQSATESFDETAAKAYTIWNQYLSAIDITTEDEQLKEKFYSNLYHSLIKPSDLTGENILGVKDDVVSDFATFWDHYKTVLPLIYMLYPDMSNKIVKAIDNISRQFGKIACSFGLTDMLPCESQAKMLGILTLYDAYQCGVPAVSKEMITACVKRELARDDFKSFLEEGVFERYTHIIDTTDACLAVAEIVEDEVLKAQLLKLAENWKNAYDEDGLMSAKSVYYEGDRYTYSFRLQKNMDERIALAGGKERFLELLDNFFGFEGDSIVQIHDRPGDAKSLDEVMQRYHRFEGFNNECDMETPFAYVLAGRQDKTCEIVHEGVTKSFGLGKGGLPGNNDSGGLSSCFVWNALGLFPASGRSEVLLGSPHFEKAVIKLASGKQLEIEAVNVSAERYHVEKAEWNGKPLTDFRIAMTELMQGGKLVVWMK